MHRTEKAIFTNLCLIYDEAGNILVQDRVDPDWGGICLPGGHVEPGESFVEAVIREVQEETGLTIFDPILCGTKQFQTDEGARYVVFFYKASHYSGTLRSSPEGQMLWLHPSELGKNRMVPDLENMLKVFDSENLSEFYYYKEDGNWKFRLL